MNEFYEKVISIADNLHRDLNKIYQPPEEGSKSYYQNIIPDSIVRNTRGYIEKVVNQINGCYEKGWYDACAVMIRRLLETLIIEVFEYKKIDNKIKNSQGDFFQLDDLINLTLMEPLWNISRNSKGAFPRLKKVGDLSAHNRRYVAHLKDIEKIKDDVRIITQELISLSGLK